MNQKLFGLVLAAAVVSLLRTRNRRRRRRQPPRRRNPPASATSAPRPQRNNPHRRHLRAATITQAPAAQTGSDADAATAPTLRLGVNEVNLIFTVTDKHGHYIPNLQQSDFALLDDQKAPAESQLLPPADQSAAARRHRHRRQHLHPLALSVRAAIGHRVPAADPQGAAATAPL